MEKQSDEKRQIAVLGATGYIGSRLVPRLAQAGWFVRAVARNADKLKAKQWSDHPQVETINGDVFDEGSLEEALRGCHAVFYLVHSMAPGIKDFANADRRAAQNTVFAAEKVGVERIIYLAGLGDELGTLSYHLRSRREVENVLLDGRVPVTVFRAAMIIGSGSASFEILRYLVDRLPVMITPRWIHTPCQPIAVRNVLHYLVACLKCPETVGEVFEIGTEEVVTYRELMQIYAEEAGLSKRLIIPIPLSPRLSSYWVHLVTPVPAALARPLTEGLRNPVICCDIRIRKLIPQEIFSCRKAISLALERMRLRQVETSWSDAGALAPVEWSNSEDPDWAGGTIFKDDRRILVKGRAKDCWPAVIGIGGKTGWHYGDWLWHIRGWMDRLIGGPGLSRGRRDPAEVRQGDALDFWRVLVVEPEHRLKLVAEMKLPGEAVLELVLNEFSDGTMEIRQYARFKPQGLAGLLYWYAVVPFHGIVFVGMLKGIAKASGVEIMRNPERI